MNNDGTDNKGKLWGIAAIVGVVAFLLLKTLVGYGFWPALLLAILIGILVAILLWIGFYRDTQEEPESLATPASAKTEVPSAAPASSADASVVSDKKTPVSEKPTAKPKVGARAKPKTKPAAKKTTAAKKPAAKAKPAAKPVANDGKPPLLKKARTGGADDLKVIKGVGPGLEKTLNDLGFYHYDQVAAWRKNEIDWVDARLKFKGRIVRDDWVKQCKKLAKG